MSVLGVSLVSKTGWRWRLRPCPRRLDSEEGRSLRRRGVHEVEDAETEGFLSSDEDEATEASDRGRLRDRRRRSPDGDEAFLISRARSS